MLYICATPIGNLQDISMRALATLQQSDIILCEDTRVSSHLFTAHNIRYKKLIALHEHNEQAILSQVIEWLKLGLLITQISDAGTPGISDPGARLCQGVMNAGFKVSPIPGACAFTCLLSVSGITAPCLFYGFVPSKTIARCKIFEQWCDASYAVCIYEAPHRILESLQDMLKILGPSRPIIMGREMTKQFETIKHTTITELLTFVMQDINQQRGEFVLIIEPSTVVKNEQDLSATQIDTLKLLLPELSPKKAVSLTVKISGGNKDLLYDYAISLSQKQKSNSN